jgi:hypothetical protein
MSTITIVLSSLVTTAVLAPAAASTASAPDNHERRAGQAAAIAFEAPVAGEAGPSEVSLLADQWAPEASGSTVDDFTDPVEPSLLSNELQFDNWCGHPVQIAVYAKWGVAWQMNAWYQLAALEGPVTLDLLTDNSYVYWYAESTDGSGWVWEGDFYLCVEGSDCYNFDEWYTGPDWGTYEMELYCF